ncbi:MAG TPA: LuxR C-terminal-related transcriptional regulator [Ktedonobacteraceae bacterium]
MPRAAACALVWLSEQEVYALRGPGEDGSLWVEDEGWPGRLEERSSFAFHGQAGHLTLRRETRQRGGEGYWYAYRNDGRRTLKRYAGRTADLSIAHLEELAADLSAALEQADRQRVAGKPVLSVVSQSAPADQRGERVKHAPGDLTGGKGRPVLPLLAPKLSIPRLPAGLVERQALLAGLDAGLERKLTLLCAPAGFGKTTLVSQWIAQMNNAEHSPAAAWVALDSGDNDPVRFWSYVIAACQQFQSGIGQAARAQLHPLEAAPFEQNSLEVPLTLLLNELSQVTTKGVLVLEDYHAITESQVHASLAFFLEHLPLSLHLVLITRGEPPLALSRLRARGELHDLGAGELRFSTAEMRAFLTQTLALEPASETVTRLDALVEGWVTGLRLLTLACQGEMSERALELRLASFSGGQRHLLEYFSSEVLATQTEEVQHFLLQTCLFNDLSAAFCDAVTGRVDSEQILDDLERANLFLLPLAGQERWYRYHPLFAEALRHESRRRLSELARRECFLQASQWYEQRGQLAEAIETALLAQSFTRAAELIKQMTGPQRFHEMREHHTLQRWLLALPASTLQSHPSLGLLLAMVHICASDCRQELSADLLARAEQPLRAAERTWQAEEDRAGLGEALAFRVVIARFQGDLARAVRLARQALAWLAEDARQWRATCLSTLGDDELRAGRLDEAHQTFQEAHACFKAAGNHYGQRIVLLSMAEIRVQQGRLHEGATLYQEVLESAGDDLSDQGQALLGLAGLDYEWNELERAESRAREALKIGERIGDEAIQIPAALLLAKIQRAHGQYISARQEVAALLARAQTHPSPLLYRQVFACEAHLQIVAGDLARAQRWLTWQSERTTALPIAQREQEKLLAARLLATQGREEEAMALLTTTLQSAHQQGRVHDEIEALLLTALTRFGKQQSRACSAIRAALDLACSAGYTRLFLDEGESVAELLRAFPLLDEKRHLATYARALLLAFSPAHGEQSAHASAGATLLPPTIEPLSPQEERVLHLLADGYSNQEIARELVVSTNTVKTQVQSVYRKLNVHSRQEVRQLIREHHSALPLTR